MPDMICKFKVDSVTQLLGSVAKRNPDGSVFTDEHGRNVYAMGEMRSVSMSPVYANGDPNHENSRFWAASPSGRFELGTVNLDAAADIKPGKEYYIIVREAE